MKLYDAKPSFAGGELAPTLHARIDLAQYAIGARTMKNWIVLPQGGIVNRPGTTVRTLAMMASTSKSGRSPVRQSACGSVRTPTLPSSESSRNEAIQRTVIPSMTWVPSNTA